MEEDLPELRIAEMQQYKDSRNTQKSKERLITAANNSNVSITQGQTVKQQNMENKNGKQNSSMDTEWQTLEIIHEMTWT